MITETVRVSREWVKIPDFVYDVYGQKCRVGDHITHWSNQTSSKVGCDHYRIIKFLVRRDGPAMEVQALNNQSGKKKQIRSFHAICKIPKGAKI